jgi:hypothetical protein
MSFYWFLLGCLGVWRVTHLLNAEDGPWDVSAKLRRAARSGFLGRLLDCFYCLSLWIAAPFAWFLGTGYGERFLLWLALSAVAILLERLTLRPGAIAPYAEEEEGGKRESDGMLRR